jgi:hypothetical protein
VSEKSFPAQMVEKGLTAPVRVRKAA